MLGVWLKKLAVLQTKSNLIPTPLINTNPTNDVSDIWNKAQGFIEPEMAQGHVIIIANIFFNSISKQHMMWWLKRDKLLPFICFNICYIHILVTEIFMRLFVCHILITNSIQPTFTFYLKVASKSESPLLSTFLCPVCTDEWNCVSLRSTV